MPTGVSAFAENGFLEIKQTHETFGTLPEGLCFQVISQSGNTSQTYGECFEIFSGVTYGMNLPSNVNLLDLQLTSCWNGLCGERSSIIVTNSGKSKYILMKFLLLFASFLQTYTIKCKLLPVTHGSYVQNSISTAIGQAA